MTSAAPPPDFIIIGAMRAGTTALAERLSHHPDIAMSKLKETDYFIAEKNYARGPHWYQSLFPPGKPIRGEASPNYTKNDVFHSVPQRICADRPDVKLIYIVRDPVDRFWSHYNHTYLMGGDVPPSDRLLDEHEGRHILASSMYCLQLSAYLEVFPPEQILVMDLDELAVNSKGAFSKVLAFVGADPDLSAPDLDRANSASALAQTPGWALKLSQNRALTGLRSAAPAALKVGAKRLLSKFQPTPRETPPISLKARERVAEALAEDAMKFRRLVGRSFSHWSI